MILDIVNQIRADSGREPLATLSSEMRLREELGLDSLELAVLTVKIEAETGLDVFAEGLVSTVGQLQERLRQ